MVPHIHISPFELCILFLYVCVHACIHVCMYVHVYVRVYVDQKLLLMVYVFLYYLHLIFFETH